MSDLRVPARALARRSVAAPGRELFRPRPVRARDSSGCSPPARATSATSSPCPSVGDFHALPQEGEGRALVRTAAGVELVSNVCRHRQAVMLRGRGNTGQNIVCPLHRWTYDLKGELIGAPHFADDPCLALANYPVQTWNGMVFEAPRPGLPGRDVAADLAGLGPVADLDFTGYAFDSVQLHECDYNWKTFIEVYLEDYHVAPFHPGLGQFVTCEDLRWEFGRTTRCRRSGRRTSSPSPARPPTASGTTRCSPTARAASPTRCPGTARSGSPTTRR